MPSYRCKSCGVEWPANYCPECHSTIDREPTPEVKGTAPAAAGSEPSKTMLGIGVGMGIVLVIATYIAMVSAFRNRPVPYPPMICLFVPFLVALLVAARYRYYRRRSLRGLAITFYIMSVFQPLSCVGGWSSREGIYVADVIAIPILAVFCLVIGTVLSDVNSMITSAGAGSLRSPIVPSRGLYKGGEKPRL